MFLESMARRAFGMGGGGALEPPTIDGQPQRRQPKVGIALGSGAARGWAHIGVLKALDELRLPIQVVSGTSMGAVAGACHAAGKIGRAHV